MVEGRDTTRPFIYSTDGEAAGYIQYWSLGQHQTPEWTGDNPWLLEFPPETVGVDLSVADPDKLSQGIGSGALRAFATALVGIGHWMIIIDPDPENRRAVAAYRRAGFRPVPHLEGRSYDVLLMQFHPETDPS
jgi:RimJ/RimL family protein N-acetyltransferase